MYEPILSAVLLAIDTWVYRQIRKESCQNDGSISMGIVSYIILQSLSVDIFSDTTMINLVGHQNLVNY